MWREEYLLFPMTEKILSEDEMDAMQGQFALVEAEIGAGVHERYEQLAARLQNDVQQA
jgi:hemerythrin-like domain-containing protein